MRDKAILRNCFATHTVLCQCETYLNTMNQSSNAGSTNHGRGHVHHLGHGPLVRRDLHDLRAHQSHVHLP